MKKELTTIIVSLIFATIPIYFVWQDAGNKYSFWQYLFGYLMWACINHFLISTKEAVVAKVKHYNK